MLLRKGAHRVAPVVLKGFRASHVGALAPYGLEQLHRIPIRNWRKLLRLVDNSAAKPAKTRPRGPGGASRILEHRLKEMEILLERGAIGMADANQMKKQAFAAWMRQTAEEKSLAQELLKQELAQLNGSTRGMRA